MSSQIAAIVELLASARSVAVLTGSGVSAESGIPTFRDAQTGLWARFRPEELATPEAFQRNPRLVWEWYDSRRQTVRAAQPNAGHQALAALQRRFSSFTLITQNVDGLHQRAGSQDVLELHGNILRSKCFKENIVRDVDDSDADVPPRCTRCGALMRPDVVWFGEALPTEALKLAMHAAQHCDVFLSIGTSALVYPAAELPHTALAAGAKLVEINRDPTPLSAHAHQSLQGKAGDILPRIVEALG
ncbi:MAG TPA: NAD-dependent deacylase [Burkholderiales bacterium]|nr:NAD-dependent deacylase [Burkholderiales bacterium]